MTGRIRDNRRTKIKVGDNLLRLLDSSGATQVELAQFCDTSQGTIADHISGKSSPKIPLLLKYKKFFEQRLHRRVTLYELTGADELKDIEQKLATHEPTPEALKLAEVIEKMPPDDPRRKAIEMWVAEEIQKMKEANPQDPSSDSDVKED